MKKVFLLIFGFAVLLGCRSITTASAENNAVVRLKNKLYTYFQTDFEIAFGERLGNGYKLDKNDFIEKTDIWKMVQCILDSNTQDIEALRRAPLYRLTYPKGLDNAVEEMHNHFKAECTSFLFNSKQVNIDRQLWMLREVTLNFLSVETFVFHPYSEFTDYPETEIRKELENDINRMLIYILESVRAYNSDNLIVLVERNNQATRIFEKFCNYSQCIFRLEKYYCRLLEKLKNLNIQNAEISKFKDIHISTIQTLKIMENNLLELGEIEGQLRVLDQAVKLASGKEEKSALKETLSFYMRKNENIQKLESDEFQKQLEVKLDLHRKSSLILEKLIEKASKNGYIQHKM